MKRFILRNAWALWVGVCLSALDVRCWQWQWWAVVMPLIVLVSISHQTEVRQ